MQYDIAPVRWSAMVRTAWRTGLAGDDEHAEQLIADCARFGKAAGIAGAPETGLLQFGLLRWQQDRVPETRSAVRTAFETRAEMLPGIALVVARVAATDEGCHEEARALLSGFARDDFASLRRGTFWSTSLILSAETACILEMPDASRAIRDLLLPFVDQIAFTGAWVTGPIAYGISVAMRGCGDARAPELLQYAIRLCEGLEAPVLAARLRESPFAS